MNALAYERISVKESYIASLYKDVLSGSGEIFIVNIDGEMVSATDKSKLGTNMKGTTYFQKFKEDEGYFQYKDQMVTYYRLSKLGWLIVKVDSMNELLNRNNVLIFILILCIILTLIFGAYFLYVQEKSIIEPVVKLSNDVCNFREGNYDISLHTKSQDEIGALNQSFIEMIHYTRNLIEQEYKSRLREQDTQLKSMQSQINPHFLYNTLDAIRCGGGS